jgi:hypothetical protein
MPLELPVMALERPGTPLERPRTGWLPVCLLCARVACNCAWFTAFRVCMLHSKLDPAFSIIGAEMAERELAAQRVSAPSPRR